MSLTVDQVKNLAGTNLSTGQVQTLAGSTPTAPSTITPSSLQPATPITPTVPPPPSIPAIPDVPQLTATAAEQQAQGVTDTLTGLNNSLVGQSDYQAQQEAQFGVSDKQKTVNDLTAQLNSLRAEQQAIPLQLQQDIQQGGANVTKGGVAPIQTAQLRENAIKALSVSSLLNAAQGNLSLALDQVDKAVKAKYDPIREQIAAQEKNLQLIMNSPEYSVEDKNRAAKAQAQLDQRKAQVETEAENKKTIQGLALQALQNGAPSAITTSIMNAPDLATAFQAAQGWASKETSAAIQEYNFYARNEQAAGRTPMSFNAYQTADANRKVAIAKAGAANYGTLPTSGISQRGKDYMQAILDGNATMQQVPADVRDEVAYGLAHQDTTDYSPLAARRFTMAASAIVTPYMNLPQYSLTANGLPYLQRIDAAIKTPGSVSDQDLLDSLTKLNTAGNAVTDAQVKLITDGRSLSDSVDVWKNKLSTGGVLSDAQRKQIQDIAKAIYANYKKGYQPVYDKATAQLKESGIPEAFWTLPDLNNLSAGYEGSSTSSNDPLGIL